ncbi:hypothetical protein CAB88_31105 (plasmid) [Bacillus thuringiensis]|uniref:Uncharacterized protein n=3 Tax=Bacillus thuringiensis TaxID=1428 RepID=A0AAP4V0L4_BACTU|nr:hypothetical protein H175_233p013 [Bacillus thuringiensis serovar thuringiensis str. IS5056]ARP61449.1 hypothetical protein CAB88_31105 [Bacillus thuringiensis]EEM31328.1 hypothetical protein bthur0003_61890 [Bacillus thuringiensis serovar thuringiensis str. T01001]EEM62485.1 hypothetical protein bthur0008_59430 [Bacillus thuringiensis serovar berliner ATCC 10792]OTW42993.1 hypothetical protein BK698_02990 [Bacillus thuringiensis serovar thuringiensis]
MNQVLRKSKKKMMYLVGSLLISLSMFSTTSFAATEGAVKSVTNSSYTGIAADINLLKSVVVKDGYVNWHLGIGASKVEGGISKTPSGYKVFLNSGYNESGQNSKYWNTQYDTSIKDGDRVNLKIINNGNGTVTMYVNGISSPVYGSFSQYEPVKMVQGVEDTGRNSFSQASFSNVLLRADTSGSSYKS